MLKNECTVRLSEFSDNWFPRHDWDRRFRWEFDDEFLDITVEFLDEMSPFNHVLFGRSLMITVIL